MDGEYRAMMRRKLLEDIYDRMSPEEKRTFVLLTMQDEGHEEIMAALRGIGKKVDDGNLSWWADFGSNVAGNYFTDFTIWAANKLLKDIRL